MTRLILVALTIAPLAQSAAPPDAPTTVVRVWNVSWQDAYDRAGHRTAVPVFAVADVDGPTGRVRVTALPQLGIVVRLDEQLRQARLAGDAAVFGQILSDQFYEMNPDGSGQTKAATIGSLGTPRIDSLSTTHLTARADGNAVLITGEETRISGLKAERSLFTHVYVRDVADDWKLLASTRIRTDR